MAGGFAPIKDVPKTLVYELADWRNAEAGRDGVTAPIPERMIDEAAVAPSSGPDQKDTDSLPPYEVLDPDHRGLRRGRHQHRRDRRARDRRAISSTGSCTMIDRAEYKRRQAAPGVKITPKAFGRDRRMPITNGYAN